MIGPAKSDRGGRARDNVRIEAESVRSPTFQTDSPHPLDARAAHQISGSYQLGM
jgi:hypothetical protein